MMRVASVLAVALAASSGGCGLFRGGPTIATYHAGAPAVSTRTAESATYSLYSTIDESRPVVRVVLPQNAEIGFRRTGVGQVVAFADGDEYPISPDRTYYWKQE